MFAYVSDTKTPQGILAIVKRLNYTMNDLMQVKNQKAPHLVVLDNLQDPGNLGTIFRTAEAAGVTGILLSKDCVDVYNPKVIRSTMGAVFRMPFLYVEDLPEKIKELQKKSIKTYAAHLRGENAYDEEDYTTGCAFLIGMRETDFVMKLQTARIVSSYPNGRRGRILKCGSGSGGSDVRSRKTEKKEIIKMHKRMYKY